jgi:hypothetical protein
MLYTAQAACMISRQPPAQPHSPTQGKAAAGNPRKLPTPPAPPTQSSPNCMRGTMHMAMSSWNSSLAA